jgi:hypothetical protein
MECQYQPKADCTETDLVQRARYRDLCTMREIANVLSVIGRDRDAAFDPIVRRMAPGREQASLRTRLDRLTLRQAEDLLNIWKLRRLHGG